MISIPLTPLHFLFRILNLILNFYLAPGMIKVLYMMMDEGRIHFFLSFSFWNIVKQTKFNAGGVYFV
jgi:hypothetical protein